MLRLVFGVEMWLSSNAQVEGEVVVARLLSLQDMSRERRTQPDTGLAPLSADRLGPDAQVVWFLLMLAYPAFGCTDAKSDEKGCHALECGVGSCQGWRESPACVRPAFRGPLRGAKHNPSAAKSNGVDRTKRNLQRGGDRGRANR